MCHLAVIPFHMLAMCFTLIATFSGLDVKPNSPSSGGCTISWATTIFTIHGSFHCQNIFVFVSYVKPLNRSNESAFHPFQCFTVHVSPVHASPVHVFVSSQVSVQPVQCRNQWPRSNIFRRFLLESVVKKACTGFLRKNLAFNLNSFEAIAIWKLKWNFWGNISHLIWIYSRAIVTWTCSLYL